MAAVVNECLIGYVLYYYSKSLLGESLFGKLKTWILIMCMLLYAVEFTRNFFETIPWQFSLALLYLEQICRLAVYVLICHFFLKAAASLVGKKRVKKWRMLINIFTSIVMAGLLSLAAYYIYEAIYPDGTDKPKPCHSFEFMLQEVLLLLVMLGFAYAAT